MTHTLARRIGAPDFLAGRRSYYLTYTVSFLVFAIACFTGLYLYGKCLIWDSDGVDQHFSFFCYFGTWMRQAISTGTLPQWDFSLGYGADVICSLASWIGDPFNLFSILCPEEYSEYLYQALSVVRLYLAGIAFSAFCRYHKRDGFATLLGALAFAFCGYCLMKGATRHAMFINPAILLPWVLLGADKILDRKSPVTFIVAMAVTFGNYFYFAYMIAIFVVLYCLLRYFVGERARKRSAREFLGLVGKFLLYGLVGALIACALLAPIVMYVLQMGRISVEHNFPVARAVITYLNLPLVYAGGSTEERALSMQALAVFAVSVLLFSSCCRRAARGGDGGGRKTSGGAHAKASGRTDVGRQPGNDTSAAQGSEGGSPSFIGALPFPETALRQTRIALVVMLVFVLVPFFGRVFNGFSYRTDRWMFALAMCSAYALVLVVPLIKELSRNDWVRIGIVMGLFVVDALFLAATQFSKVWPLIAAACLVITYVALLIVWKRSNPANPTALRVVLMVLLLVNVAQFANGGLFAHEDSGDPDNLADYQADFGNVLADEQFNPATTMLSDLGDEAPSQDAPYRFDKATELYRRNSTVMQEQDYYSTDFYASIYSQVVDDFRNDLGIAQDTAMQSHLYYTNNSRAAIEALCSVKYFLTRADAKAAKPYGFDTLVATHDAREKTYELWESDYTLPFAFTYDKVIPLDDYEAASPMKRQEGLLQGCAVEGSSLPAAEVNETAVNVPFTVVEDKCDGATMQDDGTIVCTKKNGKLTIAFKGVENAETYVYLQNMSMTQYLPGEKPPAEERGSLGFIEQVRLFVLDHAADTPDFRISFKNGSMITTTRYATTYGKYYTGRRTWLVNTGYAEKACNELTLTFDQPGTVTFDDMQVYCQPMGDFAGQVAARTADATTVQLRTNSVLSSVDAPDTRLVYFTVPYSQGWSATVDGQPATILKANSGFMAVEVSAGHHEVALSYETPYLKLGIVLSLVGLVALVVIAIVHRRRAR